MGNRGDGWGGLDGMERSEKPKNVNKDYRGKLHQQNIRNRRENLRHRRYNRRSGYILQR